MAYRLSGTDPFLRASIGAFNGYAMHGAPLSYAALLKRRSVSSWQGLYVIDNGSTTNDSFPMEFNPSNQLAGDFTTANPFQSAATFNNTTDWMIVGATWDGSTTAGHVVWRWKIGTNAWSSETDTSPGSNATAAGSGYRHLIGNEAGLGDDADYDIVCVGAIKSQLAQATFESLTMTDIASWDAVFTGSGAWLLGFDAISSRTDRTGNGGNEVSRSAGITLVSDPSGWSWGGSSTKSITPASITATSAMSGTVTALKRATPAAITASSTLTGKVVKLGAVKPASITSTSTLTGTVTKAGTASVLPAAITATSTLTGAVVALHVIVPAAITATSSLAGTVSGGSGSEGAATNPADGWMAYYYG